MARIKPTLPGKYEVDGGANKCQHILVSCFKIDASNTTWDQCILLLSCFTCNYLVVVG